MNPLALAAALWAGTLAAAFLAAELVTRRQHNTARARYTAEALAEATTRHPSAWNPGHDHAAGVACQPHCPAVLEALYLAPAAGVR